MDTGFVVSYFNYMLFLCGVIEFLTLQKIHLFVEKNEHNYMLLDVFFCIMALIIVMLTYSNPLLNIVSILSWWVIYTHYISKMNRLFYD